MAQSPKVRFRYPLHAVLLVGVSWCFFGIVLLICSLFMLPCVPLAPLLVMTMISLGGLLSSAHEYARSVATPVLRAGREARVAAPNDAQIREASQPNPG